MVKHLYGKFSNSQIKDTKKSIRGSIFFLLLCVDPDTSESYEDVDVNKAFDNLLYKIDGLNELLLYQKNIVDIMSLLKEAQLVYNSPDFDFQVYRKLILDAGAEVLKLKEVDGL